MSADGPMGDDFRAAKESSACDKAQWHYDGDFPRWTRKRQAFVHTGLFLSWLVERDLISNLLATESAKRVTAIRCRRGRPDDLYSEWDGVLVSSMLTDEGNAFVRQYYEDNFFTDYAKVFGEAKFYTVRGSWDNYDRLVPVLDERLEQWRYGSGRA